MKTSKGFMRSSVLCCLLVLSASCAYGQKILGEAERKLSGGSSRQWVLNGTRTFLGTRCENGMVYTFQEANNQKQLQRKVCKNGKWVVDRTTWKLVREGNLDTVLVLGNKGKYYIKFLEKEGQELLRLRAYGKNNATETIDLYFHYEGSE